MYPKFILKYLKENKTNEALPYLLNYLENNPFDGYAYCDIGYCYICKAEYDLAIKYLDVGNEIVKNNDNPAVKSIICLNLSATYKFKSDIFKENNYPQAIDNYFRAKLYLTDFYMLTTRFSPHRDKANTLRNQLQQSINSL